jgi:hypothetical protein
MVKIFTLKDLPKDIPDPVLSVIRLDQGTQNFIFAFAVLDFILKFLLIKTNKEKIQKKELLTFGQKVASILNNNFDFFLVFAFCVFLFEIFNVIKKRLNGRNLKN